MKKVLLSALLAAGVFNAFSQISKGTFSVGGQIGFSSSHQKSKNNNTTIDGGTSTSFSILPQAQYFIIDNFSVGLRLGYGSTSYYTSYTNSDNYTKYTEGGFQIAPFARYYYMLEDKVGFFGQAAIPLEFGNRTVDIKTTAPSQSNTSTSNPYSKVGINFSPGFIFFPSKKIGVEAILGNVLGFNSVSSESGSGNTKTTYTVTNFDFLNVNTLTLNFGLMYYFNN